MWVMQLIGRLEGSVVDLPFSAAESAIQNGTARMATDAEMSAAGVDTRQVIETADPATLPPGYLTEVTEGGGYDVRDAAGAPINIEPFPNLPAAISGAHEHRRATVMPGLHLPLDQIPTDDDPNFTLADYRLDPVEGGFILLDPAGARLGDGIIADEDAARLGLRQHYAAARGMTLEELEAEEAGGLSGVAVEVPSDWRGMHHTQKRALARRISGQQPADTAAAEDVIEEYVTRP